MKDTELKSETSYGLFEMYGIWSSFVADFHRLYYSNHLEYFCNNGELLQKNSSSLIQSVRVSCYEVAAASLTATDPAHWCQGHILLEVSVPGSVLMLVPPLLVGPHCMWVEMRGNASAAQETGWCLQKETERD